MRDNLNPNTLFATLDSTRAMSDRSARAILFAGGTGAASIVGIARRLALAGQRFELHNFARSGEHAPLHDEIDALRSHGAVYHYFDLPHELYAEKSAHAMSPARANTQVYCSGPPAFTDLIARQAREWVYASNVHTIAQGDRAA
ncbi:hypothetical protein BSFA1_66020 (plasmid) [Burkholderia sp. SFA1]|uniref:hypothetical protein n=1 Tax=unclassified Caballeronia TaxID=2646786 RepID=UPI001F2D49B9|nr:MULTISPECIES: hypothetical protein [unclassified Caballeronia]MCE4546192.1 hypothetical protein [Caballeronia sp. PC1]MCE4573333.1 hypothetical protein [Caballeronia sp. CLC5]BBQ01474.1 hypothetical protein BSFA1_66020 [Burkholderia sp. SFA1]